MLLSFKFSNLMGSVYKAGSICFSPKKNLLFSPIGNKITCLDLEKYKTNFLILVTPVIHYVSKPDLILSI